MARDYGPPRDPPPFPVHCWNGKNARARYNKRCRVWVKTGGYCFHCGAELEFFGCEAFHMDHFVPKSKRGPNRVGNLNPACPFCNKSRNNNESWTPREDRFGAHSNHQA